MEGDHSWRGRTKRAVGFCGRPDLAEKKRGENPGSIVVECDVLGDRAADLPTPEAAENAEPTVPVADDASEREQTVDEKIAPATVHGPKPKLTIGSLVQELLIDPDLGYLAIVDRVVAEFPDAKTSVRSVASVAAVLRKKGVDVPMRRRSVS